MQRFTTVLFQGISLTALLLLLSSCGVQHTTVNYPLPSGEIASPVSSISTDPALILLESEPEECLTEELDALRNTGNWEQSYNIPVSGHEEKVHYDFPVVMNKQVQVYLDLFQHQQRKQMRKWLARSGKYLPMFRAEFREAGLPEDLAYLAMIESGFNQRAYSRSRAVGLWQFMKGTGKQYHLKIDRYVDERRHAEKSTKAAAAYLGDLYADFGDWHLAVAAYNGGPGKIRRGMKRYKTDNFWSLAQHRYLRLETKRYVPKLIAAIFIAKDPEKYGFTNIKYQSPMEYETLRVGPGLSLDAVALLCNVSSRKTKSLNPELKTGRTPLNKSYYDVNIPVGTKTLAEANLSRLNSVVTTGYKTHIIRKGDTLSKICRRYKINKTTLLKVNNLRKGKLIAGAHLRIPHSTVRYHLAPKGSQGKIASENLILHTIKPGESVSKIARIYNVPPQLIVSWNGLRNVHKIRAGQQLALYIDTSNTQSKQKISRTESVSPVNPHADSNSKLIVLSQQKKFSVQAATDNNVQVSWYKVRRGDSLWKIARRFNLSTRQIKTWNNLRSDRIQPGTRLMIKDV